eukprot:UN13251
MMDDDDEVMSTIDVQIVDTSGPYPKGTDRVLLNNLKGTERVLLNNQYSGKIWHPSIFLTVRYDNGRKECLYWEVRTLKEAWFRHTLLQTVLLGNNYR